MVQLRTCLGCIPGEIVFTNLRHRGSSSQLRPPSIHLAPHIAVVICLLLELPMYKLSIKIIALNRTREFFIGMIDQLAVRSHTEVVLLSGRDVTAI